ncbi:MAG: M16 family metallopeptidase [Sphingomonadales bacterium]
MARFERRMVSRARMAALALSVIAGAFATRTQAVEIQEVVSPDGIEAWLVEEHSIPLIAIEIAFRGGAALDPDGKDGLAFMVSGLLDEGAGDLDAQAFQEQLEDRAIRMSFDAGRDHFTASMRTLSENRDQAFDLLGLALTAPRFDDDAVARIRGQVQALLASRAEDPNAIASRRWYQGMFGAHPYGRSMEGTAETVAALTVDDLRGFVTSRIACDNMTIAVVGDIDAATLGDVLDRAFANLTEQSAAFRIPEFKAESRAGIEVVRREVPQSVMLFGHRGIKRNDPDWYGAVVMNYILGGGGFSSRLMTEVREKRGLAYSVSSGFRPFEHAGLFLGGAGTENARAAETMALIRAEIARLHREGVDETELADAKTYLTGSFALNFASSGQIASRLVAIQLNQLGIDYIDRRNGYIEAVSASQIKRVAGRLLQPDNLFWVVVGDPQGLEAVAD